MKKPSYADFLSTSCLEGGLFVDGVGHFRSPTLKEVFNFGYEAYRLYVTFLKMGKDDLLHNTNVVSPKLMPRYESKKDEWSLFDLMVLNYTHKPNELNYIQIMGEAISYFLVEDEILRWDNANHKYLVCKKDTDNKIGEITKITFDDVRDVVLKLNYAELETPETLKYKEGDEKAKRLWAIAQERLRKLNSQKGDDKSLHLGNIISKVCASGAGYTYENVFDLTVFQLFDVFSQISWFRQRNLIERIYSNHGDDKKKGNVFEYESWMKNMFEK